MSTLADLQAQLAALDDRIAAGTTEIRHGGKVIKYNTTADLLSARESLVQRIAAATTPTRSSPRYQLASFSD